MSAGRLSGLLALLLLFSSAPAAAYVRTLNSAKVPIRWANTCISLVAHTDNVPKPLDAASMFKAVEAAGKIWGRPSYSCTPLTLTTTEDRKNPGTVARDSTNRVMMVTDRWCRQTGTADRLCYPKNTLAITTLVADSRGKIIEADVEINAVDFRWDDRALRPTSEAQDLQSVLVHELGHLVGLDHNCAYPGTIVNRLDNDGEPVPECNTASHTMRSTVMYPSANDLGEIKRRLSADETRFVCEIYPAPPEDLRPVCGPALPIVAAAEQAAPDDAGGCSLSGRRSPSGRGGQAATLGLALIGLIGLGLRRRGGPGSRRA